MTRYVLWPGHVTSQYDGQRHFIGVADLRVLYHVPRNAHVVIGGEPGFRPLPDDVNCYPRNDGAYPETDR